MQRMPCNSRVSSSRRLASQYLRKGCAAVDTENCNTGYHGEDGIIQPRRAPYSIPPTNQRVCNHSWKVSHDDEQKMGEPKDDLTFEYEHDNNDDGTERRDRHVSVDFF